MDGTLRIASVTGIDVELRIAGPGGRSYAFVIDWHIRVLVVFAWLFASAVAYIVIYGLPSSETDEAFAGLVVALPAALLYFLYHPVLEIAMQGRTPGKRIAGVRIVRRDGGVPGPGQLLVRNLFRLVDSLPMFYCVGLAATMLTQQAVRIGDIAAGTLLVYDRGDVGPRLEEALSPQGVERLGLERADLVGELLSRWDELGPATRGRLARQLLGKLGRAPGDAADDVELRSMLEGLLR